MEADNNKQMKKVGEILSRQSGTSRNGKDTSKSTARRSFLSKEELLSQFAPDKQSRYSRERERCVTGTAPRLSEVADQYGEKVAIEWLMAQLYNLDSVVGYSRKLEQSQYDDLASMILNRFGNLKLTEIMLFLNDCKAGEYGKSYGYIDIIQLMSNLRQFTNNERGRIIHDKDEREKKTEKQEKTISGKDARDSLNREYVRRIRDNDYSVREVEDESQAWVNAQDVRENALEIRKRIARQDFSQWLGGIARVVEGLLIDDVAPIYARRIADSDYSGEVGEWALKMHGMIGRNEYTDDFAGKLARRVDWLLKFWQSTPLDGHGGF